MTSPATITTLPITTFPITRFTIPHDHPCLPGHFPGRPIVPGVVVLDRVLAAIEAGHGGALGALRMPQVKFAQPLLPAKTEVELLVEARRLLVTQPAAACSTSGVAGWST